jgi:hypothetical protein
MDKTTAIEFTTNNVISCVKKLKIEYDHKIRKDPKWYGLCVIRVFTNGRVDGYPITYNNYQKNVYSIKSILVEYEGIDADTNPFTEQWNERQHKWPTSPNKFVHLRIFTPHSTYLDKDLAIQIKSDYLNIDLNIEAALQQLNYKTNSWSKGFDKEFYSETFIKTINRDKIFQDLFPEI